MDNLKQGNGGKYLVILVIIALIVIIGVLALIKFFPKEDDRDIDQIAAKFGYDNSGFAINTPIKYNQSLIIKSFDQILSIQPVKAREVKQVKEKDNIIKYINAYQNTDVVQTQYTNKLKEDIVLKEPGHPDSFEYEINTDDFVWEVDESGDILFKQKEKVDRFEIQEKKQNVILATMDMDYSDGYPVVFRIPAPFLIDSTGEKSSIDKVKVEFKGNRLILIPDRDWLKKHTYPIILDPTIERVERNIEKVVFGDEDSQGFKPKMQLNKWGEEAHVTLEYQPEGKTDTEKKVMDQYVMQDDKIIWKGDNKIGVEMYQKEPELISDEGGQGFVINENGGVEFDLILKQKPDSNVFEYRLESQGLEFYYQPELTQAEKDRGAYRPEHIIGSYAVYHSSKINNEYKTGKAFHIYRPKIIDSRGDWIWGELNINTQTGILTITVDNNWLMQAQYPVIVDPNFGHDNKGGSSIQAYNDEIDGTNATTTSAGTVTSITMYLNEQNADANIKLGIYKTSDESLVGYTEEWTITSGFDNWHEFSIISGGSITAQEYWLVGFFSNNTNIFYDSNALYDYDYQSIAYGSFPNPFVPVHYTNGRISIYATYTAAAAAPESKAKIKGGSMQIKGGSFKINKIEAPTFVARDPREFWFDKVKEEELDRI